MTFADAERDRSPFIAPTNLRSPPTLVTVVNADPLRPHSELLVERLREQGVETETLFFPDEHGPPLDHEYQFDLDREAGQLVLGAARRSCGGRSARRHTRRRTI
jgi:acetyl esterase/lipase